MDVELMREGLEAVLLRSAELLLDGAGLLFIAYALLFVLTQLYGVVHRAVRGSGPAPAHASLPGRVAGGSHAVQDAEVAR